MTIILSTACSFFLVHSPNGLVEPGAVENGTLWLKYDVVDVNRSGHGFIMLFEDSNAVFGVFNWVFDES